MNKPLLGKKHLPIPQKLLPFQSACQDREITSQGIKRIHQEDFCQALGCLSQRKYQNEGGPGYKGCFNLLENGSHPAIDRNAFATAIIFNYLIGNRDAHAKNFSILHPAHTGTRLAPFYDIVCTNVYSDLTNKMAMKIGSQYEAKRVLPRHWQQLCQEVNYSYPTVIKLIEKIGDDIKQAVADEKTLWKSDNMFDPIIDKIITCVETNIDQTRKRFN